MMLPRVMPVDGPKVRLPTLDPATTFCTLVKQQSFSHAGYARADPMMAA